MSQTLQIEVETNATDSRPVFLAGTFNDWQSAQEAYRMKPDIPGYYSYTFPNVADLDFPLEFKATRGNWKQVETDAYGGHVDNHRLEKPQEHIRIHVPRWKINGQYWKDEYLPKIEIIHERFEIPQLIKTRRIAALLPWDYDQSDKRYPVLYLQDGQNLFDDYAPFGSWGLDKKLATMAENGWADLIVIAIDHAENERISEYTPSYQTKLGPGDGKKYVRFLADTLKPYVDKHFRTLPDRQHTGIGGSSMGGLISIYAGSLYPEVYGKQMIFSPSLWVAPEIYRKALQTHMLYPTQIYVYAGGDESENMVPLVEQFSQGMDANNPDAITLRRVISPKGKHRETDWGKAFPEAANWLFGPYPATGENFWTKVL
ncbi:MAG: carbohydrate esterase [Bacteroidetes bacterium]|nr:carbohydrate esterase [Bacteroidota bacterium]